MDIIEELKKSGSGVVIGRGRRRETLGGPRRRIEDTIRVSTQKNARDGEQEEVYIGRNILKRHPGLKGKIKVTAFPKRRFIIEATTPDDRDGHEMRKGDNKKRAHFHFKYHRSFPRTKKLTEVKILEERQDCVLCEVPK